MLFDLTTCRRERRCSSSSSATAWSGSSAGTDGPFALRTSNIAIVNSIFPTEEERALVLGGHVAKLPDLSHRTGRTHISGDPGPTGPTRRVLFRISAAEASLPPSACTGIGRAPRTRSRPRQGKRWARAYPYTRHRGFIRRTSQGQRTGRHRVLPDAQLGNERDLFEGLAGHRADCSGGSPACWRGLPGGPAPGPAVPLEVSATSTRWPTRWGGTWSRRCRRRAFASSPSKTAASGSRYGVRPIERPRPQGHEIRSLEARLTSRCGRRRARFPHPCRGFLEAHTLSSRACPTAPMAR